MEYWVGTIGSGRNVGIIRADHLPIHVVKELMGHSDIATTQKFYSQVEKYQRWKAATVIQALVGEPEKEKPPKAKEGGEGYRCWLIRKPSLVAPVSFSRTTWTNRGLDLYRKTCPGPS
jgi:hypothetical protein